LVPAGQHASVKTRKNYNCPSNEPTSSGGHKIVNGKTANRPKTLDSALQRIEQLERETRLAVTANQQNHNHHGKHNCASAGGSFREGIAGVSGRSN
jgi:hypothetical protein